MNNRYFLDVGEKFIIRDKKISAQFPDCYRVWPHELPMPPFYGHDEVLQASSFKTCDTENEASEISNENGNSPVYWMHHPEEEEGSLVVTRIN